MRRSVCLAVLSLSVLGLGLVGCSAEVDGESTGESESALEEVKVVKVMTINLLHDFPRFRNIARRTRIVADAIVAEQPDFVALQEASEAPIIRNRAKLLAELTGYQWTWRKASGFGPIFQEGPGILSRWPIAWAGGLDLPHKTNFGLAGRTMSAILANTPYGNMYMYSTHLEDASGEAVNADQARAASDYIDSISYSVPAFLAGDFNATPDGLSSRFLRGETPYGGETANYTDAWQSVNPTDPGFTSPNPGPNRRIDYIYVIPSTTSRGRVLGCKTLFADPVSGIYASDHLGIVCTIALK